MRTTTNPFTGKSVTLPDPPRTTVVKTTTVDLDRLTDGAITGQFIGVLIDDKRPSRLQTTKRRATRPPWRTRATAEEMARQENRRRLQVSADYLSECQAAYEDFEALRIDNDAYRTRVREARRVRDARLA